MKRLLPIAVLLSLICCRTHAIILYSLDAPQDDMRTRRSLTNRVELEALRTEFLELMETHFLSLKPSDVTKIFGPKLSQPPVDLVLPIYDSGRRILSGGGGFPAQDWHAIGNLGYLQVYWYHTVYGERIGDIVFYHIADKNFVPLRYKEPFPTKLAWDKATTTGLAKWVEGRFMGDGYRGRLAWDTARFNAIKKWMDEHLPKMTDLGTMEVSPKGPTRVGLGAGRDCLITTRLLTRPGMTNDWLDFTLSLDSPDAKEREKSLVFRSVSRPNQPIGFAMDGNFFRLTPKLKRE